MSEAPSFCAHGVQAFQEMLNDGPEVNVQQVEACLSRILDYLGKESIEMAKSALDQLDLFISGPQPERISRITGMYQIITALADAVREHLRILLSGTSPSSSITRSQYICECIGTMTDCVISARLQELENSDILGVFLDVVDFLRNVSGILSGDTKSATARFSAVAGYGVHRGRSVESKQPQQQPAVRAGDLSSSFQSSSSIRLPWRRPKSAGENYSTSTQRRHQADDQAEPDYSQVPLPHTRSDVQDLTNLRESATSPVSSRDGFAQAPVYPRTRESTSSSEPRNIALRGPRSSLSQSLRQSSHGESFFNESSSGSSSNSATLTRCTQAVGHRSIQRNMGPTVLFDEAVPLTTSFDDMVSSGGTAAPGTTRDMELDDWKYQIVRECADCSLTGLLRHLNNYPPPFGPAMMQSLAVEAQLREETPSPERSPTEPKLDGSIHLLHNDTTILSVVESSCSSHAGHPSQQLDAGDLGAVPGLLYTGSTSKGDTLVIARNSAGRYAWSFRLFNMPTHTHTNGVLYRENFTEACRVSEGVEHYTLQIGRFSKEMHRIKSKDLTREAKTCPTRPDTPKTDKLAELLPTLSIPPPACLFSTPLPIHETITAQIEKEWSSASGDLIETQIANARLTRGDIRRLSSPEDLTAAENTADNDQDNQLKRPGLVNRKFQYAEPRRFARPATPFFKSRALLVQLGLLSDTSALNMLTESQGLYRDLRSIDRKPIREIMKIAVLYVGPGQTDEASILRNSAGSPAYNHFVASLGWRIDVASHPGYLGGLERNGTTGNTAFYFCTSSVEVIFHDVTQMPTDHADARHLKKKRHIGNDHVHIVWNEHDAPYNPDTISGDFGSVQLVVTPLADGKFLVNVHRDAEIEFFGPATDGVLVSGFALGPLIRISAINGYRAILKSIRTISKHPFTERQSDIKSIGMKYRQQKLSTAKMLGHIFMLDPK